MSLLPVAVLLLAALLCGPARGRRVPVLAALAALAVALPLTVSGALPPVQAAAQLFTLVLIVAVAVFSRRHLDGDPDQPAYDRRLLVTAGAAVAALSTSDLAILAVAWIVTGAGLTALVGHHRGLAATTRAVRSLRQARLVGDAALVLAVVTLSVTAGSTSVERVLAEVAAAPDAPAVRVAGLALIVTAAARAGLLPFSRWIPLSIVAPAPVSALLHAGIANAPVLLLLQLAPVWRADGVLPVLLCVLGVATAVLTFPRLLVRADVKTRLAWSTTAQLGFMLTLLAVGAEAAAVLHLVLHGIYKAVAFLNAGDQMTRARSDSHPSTASSTRTLGAAGGLFVGGLLVTVDAGWEHPLTAVAVVVATTAAGAGLMSVRASAGTRAAAAAVAALVVAGVLAAGHAASGLLDLPLRADGSLAWAAAAAVAALALVGVVPRATWPRSSWILLHRLADPVVPLQARRRLRPVGLPAIVVRPELHDGLRLELADAAASVPPYWGWQAAIAVNPLLGEQHRPFTEAVEVAAGRGWSTLPGLSVTPGPAADLADELVSGWLAAWTCLGDVPWPAPGREQRLWDWFREVAATDPVLPARTRSWLGSLPDEPLDVVAGLLPLTAHPAEAARAQLLRLPGWAGYLSRRDTLAAALDVDALIGLLAVQLAVVHAVAGTRSAQELAVGGPVHQPVGNREVVGVPAALAVLEEREAAIRTDLLDTLAGPVPARAPGRRTADLVLCIDVRSELLRRHLEAVADVRTVGFAGFFGIFVRRAAEDGRVSDRLPAPLSYASVVNEAGPAAPGAAVLLMTALRAALDSPGGGFAAVDAGSVKGLLGVLRVLRPGLWRTVEPAGRPLQVPAESEPGLVAAAVGAVSATGLHGPDTAPLVVLVGHGSTSTNNPAESAFDCGACGGSRGGFNARLAALVLNGAAGRAALAEAGLAVPADTVFVGAEHDTALDQVFVLEPDTVPATHTTRLAALQDSLGAASAATAAERCRVLPGAEHVTGTDQAVRHVRRRALDTAEVRHEWGLAGNAFFIAAPRALTAGLDLGGRAFLHDYDAQQDPDGALLEVILTAPLVVAQWINAQYFFSTCDTEALGAGSKTAHNAVGALGVLTGPSGDLRIGLAEQSVRHLGRPQYEPVRLLAVVAAAPEAVDAVLERHPSVGGLVTGDWLALCTVDVATGVQRVRTAAGWNERPPRSQLTVPRQGAVAAVRG